MSSFPTTHEGLERILEGTRVLSNAVGPTRSLRTLPLIVLTGIVTAVVALAMRRFGNQLPEGFTAEWLVLWGLGAAAALVFARISVRIGNALIRQVARFGSHLTEVHAQAAYRELARQDPRVLADLQAAISRAERD